MPDLAQKMEDIRTHLTPHWTAEREARVRAGLERARGRARARRLGSVVALCVLGLVGADLALRSRVQPQPVTLQSAAPAPPAPSAAHPSLLHLPDGSEVVAASGDARVDPLEIGAGNVTLRLSSGAARFSVTPNHERPFQVLAGDLTVTVLGTVFSVGLEAGGVRVSVERGLVRVSSPSTLRELSAGESALIAPAPAALPTPPVAASEAPARPAAPPTPSWRALAQSGEYQRAFARMQEEGPNAVRDTPEELELAADVARISGHPAQAVALLKRVVAHHPGDAHAPLAAFTLGRTLLEQLGQPRGAAEAFARARRLDPGGPLAQDALFHEVESWSRAHDGARTRQSAEQYLELYPSNRRAMAVRELAHLR